MASTTQVMTEMRWEGTEKVVLFNPSLKRAAKFYLPAFLTYPQVCPRANERGREQVSEHLASKNREGAYMEKITLTMYGGR